MLILALILLLSFGGIFFPTHQIVPVNGENVTEGYQISCAEFNELI